MQGFKPVFLEEWIKIREQSWVPPSSFNTNGQTHGIKRQDLFYLS